MHIEGTTTPAWPSGVSRGPTPSLSCLPSKNAGSFSCELTLRSTPQSLRVLREPIREIALLHQTPDTWSNRTLRANQTLRLAPAGREFHLQAKLNIPEGAKFNLFPLTSAWLDSSS